MSPLLTSTFVPQNAVRIPYIQAGVTFFSLFGVSTRSRSGTRYRRHPNYICLPRARHHATRILSGRVKMPSHTTGCTVPDLQPIQSFIDWQLWSPQKLFPKQTQQSRPDHQTLKILFNMFPRAVQGTGMRKVRQDHY